METFKPEQDENANKELLKKITKPFTKLVIQVLLHFENRTPKSETEGTIGPT